MYNLRIYVIIINRGCLLVLESFHVETRIYGKIFMIHPRGRASEYSHKRNSIIIFMLSCYSSRISPLIGICIHTGTIFLKESQKTSMKSSNFFRSLSVVLKWYPFNYSLIFIQIIWSHRGRPDDQSTKRNVVILYN